MFLRILLLLFISGITFTDTQSQDFQYHSTFPFGIQLVDSTGERIVYKLMFIDRDQDGDQDLFLTSLELGESEELDFFAFSYHIEYQENIGTATEPEFSQIASAFDTLYIPDGYFYPSCGDLNGDGKPDFIAMAETEYLSEIQHLLFYLSSGDTFDIKRDFEFDLDPFVPLSRLLPTLADLDADGDLDIALSGMVTSNLADTTQEFRVLYAKNIGDQSNPEFLGWFNNPYDIVQDTSGEFIQIADIDMDGDMDVISIASRNEIFSLIVKENISDDIHRPSFSQEKVSPYNMPVATEEFQFLDFSLVDIDGDTDLDLFTFAIGDDAFQIDYYENIQCVEATEELFIEICQGDLYEGYSQSGTYKDTFQMQNCDSIRTLNLTVHQVYDQSERYMKCEGDTLFLGDQIITSSGSYMTTLQSTNGCDSTITANVTFYLIDAAVTLEENKLSALGGYNSYQWINCATGEDVMGQVNDEFVPEQTGSYAVRITTAAGCIKTSECVEVVVSSIEQQILSNRLVILPNPTNDHFVLQNSTGKKIDQLKIIDFNGRIINDFNHPYKQQINVSELTPGCYLVLVTIGEYVIPKKLIII